MGLFDFFKKPKSDLEQYYEDRRKKEEQISAQNISYESESDLTSAYTDSDFHITVEDVFTITGRGTVITGCIESGCINVGDTVKLKRLNGSSKDVTVTGIEMFRKILDSAQAGDNVGLLLHGITKNDISKGDVLFK